MKRKIIAMILVLTLSISMWIGSWPLPKSFFIQRFTHGLGNPYIAKEYFWMPPEFEGDFNGDGKIDMMDVGMAARDWGSYWFGFPNGIYHPHPSWDARCDLNGDGKIDMKDIGAVAKRVGLTEGCSPYVAYSADYELIVPDDGDEQVCYHHMVKMYVPDALNGKDLWFITPNGVDDWLFNVMVDGKYKYFGNSDDPPCVAVNVDLGVLPAGLHLLEFDYIEQWASGGFKFYVAVDGDPNNGFAYLTRFRIYVPNYGDQEVRYTVKTHTNFPISDDYFLMGRDADDFIDDLKLAGGLLWQDWMWDMGPEYGAIYAWGDGFCYPLGYLDPPAWRDIEFTFGEMGGAGLLDYEILSWTNQRNRFGQPKFYAFANIMNLGDHISLNNAQIFGGSRWESPIDPEISERTYEIRTVYDVSYAHESKWFNAKIELGIGNRWAEWGLSKGSHDDVGIPLNLTLISFETNFPTGYFLGAPNYWRYWGLYLAEYTIDIYSFPYLRITGMEADIGDSKGKINPDYTIAADFSADVIMFISSVFIGGTPGIVGATVGMSIKGVLALLKYYQGQEVSRYDSTIQEDHHWQLTSTRLMKLFPLPNPALAEHKSESDLVFLGLEPTAGKHCGLTKIVLKGKLTAVYFLMFEGGWPIGVEFPIGNIEITLYIPWFLWT